jgi:hypothetical protein
VLDEVRNSTPPSRCLGTCGTHHASPLAGYVGPSGLQGLAFAAAVYKLVVHDEIVHIAAVELISGFLDPVL